MGVSGGQERSSGEISTSRAKSQLWACGRPPRASTQWGRGVSRTKRGMPPFGIAEEMESAKGIFRFFFFFFFFLNHVAENILYIYFFNALGHLLP